MNTSPNIIQDYPDAFLKRMAGLLGDEYHDFLAYLYQPAKIGMRVNTLKTSPQEYLLHSPSHLVPVPWCPSGFVVEEIKGRDLLSPGKHPYHDAGLYYLQEPSAMAAAEILAPMPGEIVLDLSAAPGGKATHLAALMMNSGLLVANEIHPKRVWDLVENLERCGVTNSVVTAESPQRLADHFGEYFDCVLLDAPCSGEGMFRKNELARWEWKPELVRSCAIRQAAILEQAARLVKPGGRLAYTTCTFSSEENEGVISSFLYQHHEFELSTIQPAPGFTPARHDWITAGDQSNINRAIRIWPHLAEGEGHFIALMLKRESGLKHHFANSARARISSSRASKPVIMKQKDEIQAASYLEKLSLAMEFSRIFVDGTYIYQLPDPSPNLSGLMVIRHGWWLGTMRKARLTPSHALAMGIRSQVAKHNLSFSIADNRLPLYFYGNTIADSGDDAWVLITVNGFPIGWGKRTQNVIKNFYPRGLRH